AADRGAVRAAVRQDEQDRRGGRRGDLGSRAAAWDAIRCVEERGATGGAVAASHAGAAGKDPNDAGLPGAQPELRVRCGGPEELASPSGSGCAAAGGPDTLSGARAGARRTAEPA